MVEEQKPRRLREEDCLIDWKNHPAEDENGNPIVEDWTELRNEWLQEDCECNEYSLGNRERCYRYYSFDYDENLFKQWMKQHNYTENNIAYWGLERMFDDGWIKSPAFVDWRDMRIIYSLQSIKTFVENRSNYDTRVAILTYFINNADYLFGHTNKQEYLPSLRNLRDIHKEAAKVYKQEQDRLNAEQRKQAPKEKPEFVLSLDEILEYVKNTNPESAPSIRSMLYYMMLHKEGWNKPAILKKIDAMDGKIVHNGDNVYGNKHVGTQIDNVAPKAIGMQEVHE